MVIAEIAVGLAIISVVIGLLVMAMVWERRAGHYDTGARTAPPVQVPLRQRTEDRRAA